jgi:DMSO/TMAO reductase YedYZ molybdopterin-dependent catalytic subunit
VPARAEVPVAVKVFQGRGGRDPRLPPGQYDVGSSFPVLTAEATPNVRLDRWSFRVDGLVAAPREWTWPEFAAMPART